MSSKSDRKSGYIYKLCKRLEDQFDQQYDAEQEQRTIKLESDSDDEQEIVISTTTSEALLTSLKMTCSDSENSSNELPGLTGIPNVLELQDGIVTKESTIATVMNMFSSISKQVTTIHKKTDRVQREITSISERLGRVEKKMGISLATLEQMKDIIVQHDDTPVQECFSFNQITNEEEFDAFNIKLGAEEEYYERIKTNLNKCITAKEANNRMVEAMDMIFDKTFMTLCSWTGQGYSGPKIPFRTRRNVLQLFVDIGSNKYITISQICVEEFFRNKLKHAKQRVNIQGLRKSSCHKRKRMLATEHVEKKAK